MPHQCTGCGHTFEDGSKEMLSGCPECGGNKFQFRPGGAALSDAPPDPESDPTESLPDEDSSVAETVGRATTKVRDLVSSDSSPAQSSNRPSTDSTAADTSPVEGQTDHNSTNAAQTDEPDGSAVSGRSDPTTVGGEAASTPDPDAEWPSKRDTADDSGLDTPSGSGGNTTDDEIIDADARRIERLGAEDNAQASARSDVVSSNDLADSPADDDPTDAPEGEPAPTATAAPPPRSSAGTDPADGSDTDSVAEAPPSVDADGEIVSEPTEAEPDIDELREHLNDQFESIKILEPGQYELNLMELYDREEYIIALQENGRYVIQVPEQWIGDEPGLE